MTSRLAAILWCGLAGAACADSWNGGGLISEGERRAEVTAHAGRLTALMTREHLGAIVLTRSRNQAWLLAGTDPSIIASRAESPVWLLLTREGRKYLVSSNIDGERLMSEEGLANLGFEERRFPWFAGEGSGPDERWRIVAGIAGDARVGADAALPGCTDYSSSLAQIRFPLSGVEMRRMRWLGTRVGAAVADACRELKPGQRENEIAAGLAARLAGQSITPTVVLVGGDERLERYRRPVPTDAKVRTDVLVSGCGARWGLVVAVSRLVHFGALPAERAKRMQSCAAVAAALLKAARPGTSFRDLLERASAAYAREGYPEEWRNRDQGGAIACFEDESLLAPDAGDTVVEGMALAFHPTLPGVTVEDTILVGPHGGEVLTRTPGWPMRKVMLEGAGWELPDILVRAGTP